MNEEQEYGIAIVANDNVISWLLPFLESYRATNSAIPLFVIPYDSNVASTRHAADVYGATWVESDLAEIDQLAERLYPFSPNRRRRLRKLQALALPLDKVIYLDVDTVLFRDFRDLFRKIDQGVTDFIVASSSNEYVYNNKHLEFDYLNNVILFSDGFFLTSRKILSISDFCDVIGRDEKIFHAVRKRGGLYAQPLVNFVVHRQRLQVKSLAQCVPGASDETYYKADGVTFGETGPVDRFGREIYFAHWAGAIRTPRRRVFDEVWRDYSKRATERVKL
jgi:hypothetical protein